MHRLLPVLTLAGLLLFPGCGQPAQAFSDCSGASDGKVLLLWTVRGQDATATGCQGISELVLVLAPDQCSSGVEIEPIPCERDGVGWRYDNLPSGGATLELTAKDTGGAEILHGSTRVTLDPTLPPAPAPIDLE